MTLTDALRAALADPPNLEPLRKMSAHGGMDVREVYRNLTADLLRVSLRAADHLADHMPIVLDVLHKAGASLEDLRTVCRGALDNPEIPRSAEWVSAAERLAAWADGVTP